MSSITVYGIKQCDTVREALRWLEGKGIAHQLHDLRVDGFDRPTLDGWLQTTGFDSLVNRRSTTWRKLSDSEKKNTDPAHLTALLLANPTLVKRPVFVANDEVLGVGFTASVQADLEQLS